MSIGVGGNRVKLSAFAAVCVAVVVVGCAQTPKTIEEVNTMCTKRFAGMRSEHVSELAQYMRTSREKAPALACKRIIAALKSGRISTKDFANMERASSPVWKVLKGQ